MRLVNLAIFVALCCIPSLSLAQQIGIDTGAVMLGAYQQYAGIPYPTYSNMTPVELEMMMNEQRLNEPKVTYSNPFHPIYLQDEMNRSSQRFKIEGIRRP